MKQTRRSRPTVRPRRAAAAAGVGAEFLQAALDGLGVELAILDRRGVILAVNDAWRRFGDANGLCMPGHAVGANYLAVCDAAAAAGDRLAEGVAAGVRAVLAGTDERFSVEYPCAAPGDERWFALRATRVVRRGTVRVLITHEDTSERRRVEAALRASHARFAAFMDHTPANAWIKDAEGRLVYANRQLAKAFGRTVESMLGRTDDELWPGSADEFARNDAKVMASGRPARFVEPVETPAGRRETLVVKFPMTDAGGARLCGGVGLDITRERQARRELERGAARTRLLAEVSDAFARARLDLGEALATIVRVVGSAMQDGCTLSLLADDGATLRLAAAYHPDPAACALVTEMLTRHPWPADEGLARTVLCEGRPLLLWPGSPAAMRALMAPEYQVYNDRYPTSGLAAVPMRLDGEPIGVVALWRERPAPAYDGDDAVLLQQFADRAALAVANARLYAQLEQRVRERTRELEAANRELEAFSYSVSHDLRAPLRTILGFGAVLREEHGDALGDDGLRHLERMRAAGERMEELIDALLGLSRMARAELFVQPVSLSAVAARIGDELAQAQPQRRVRLRVAPGLSAAADEALLRVVLANLLDNAWKYTAQRAEAHVEVGAETREGERVFYVRDDGAGFDMRYADKLFGPFQRLHAAAEFPGSGIGLATVQRIIHRHGGRIWAEAAEGRGATFYFTLPG